MIDIFKRIMNKIRFKAYINGYYKGYQHACKRFHALDGRYLPYKFSDVVLGQQFAKSPRTKFRKAPWSKGFEFGYTDALAQYNAGRDAHNSEETLVDIYDRVCKEFEKDRKFWETSQTKQLP